MVIIWGKPERAPQMRVCCKFLLLFLYTVLRRAVNQLHFLCVINFPSLHVSCACHVLNIFGLFCKWSSWSLQASQALYWTKKSGFDIGCNEKWPSVLLTWHKKGTKAERDWPTHKNWVVYMCVLFVLYSVAWSCHSHSDDVQVHAALCMCTRSGSPHNGKYSSST